MTNRLIFLQFCRLETVFHRFSTVYENKSRPLHSYSMWVSTKFSTFQQFSTPIFSTPCGNCGKLVESLWKSWKFFNRFSTFFPQLADLLKNPKSFQLFNNLSTVQMLKTSVFNRHSYVASKVFNSFNTPYYYY